jgi:hypothetical protein
MSVQVKLSWEQVLKQFDNLIKFAASQQVQNNRVDRMVSAEDLYQEGLIKLHQCWVKWCVERGKDMDEFGPIFRKSLFRRVKQSAGKRQITIDLEDAANTIEDDNIDDPVERMYRDNLIGHLNSLLVSETSRRILQELVTPSPRTLFEVWADRKRKEMIKSQGHRANIPQDNTIRMKHIQRALGITTKQYDNAMSEIREKAKLALDM